MNDEILAIDPGREKTGIAILKNSDVLKHKIKQLSHLK
jgi:RNase H-fold protein (predicted Holliday junction resolvase)